VNTTTVAGTLGLLRNQPSHRSLSLGAKIGISFGVTVGVVLPLFGLIVCLNLAGEAILPRKSSNFSGKFRGETLILVSIVYIFKASQIRGVHTGGQEPSLAGQPQMHQTPHAEQRANDSEERRGGGA